jgi:hypothetical protein
MKFQEKFDDYVCDGDTLTLHVTDNIRLTATVIRDDDYRIDDDDGHNPDPEVTGCNAEQQKTLLINRKAWFHDKWWYGGVIVELYIHDRVVPVDSLWGIEVNYPGSDNSYLTEVANEMLAGINVKEEIQKRIDSLQIEINELSRELTKF